MLFSDLPRELFLPGSGTARHKNAIELALKFFEGDGGVLSNEKGYDILWQNKKIVVKSAFLVKADRVIVPTSKRETTRHDLFVVVVSPVDKDIYYFFVPAFKQNHSRIYFGKKGANWVNYKVNSYESIK